MYTLQELLAHFKTHFALQCAFVDYFYEGIVPTGFTQEQWEDIHHRFAVPAQMQLAFTMACTPRTR